MGEKRDREVEVEAVHKDMSNNKYFPSLLTQKCMCSYRSRSSWWAEMEDTELQGEDYTDCLDSDDQTHNH